MALNNVIRRVFKTDDCAKLLLWAPCWCLKLALLWPGSNFGLTQIVSSLIHAGGITFIAIGCYFYIQEHSGDFSKMSNAIWLLLSPLLSLISNLRRIMNPYDGYCMTYCYMVLQKLLVFLYISRNIRKLINEIMLNFWPYNLVDDEENINYTLSVLKYLNIIFITFNVVAYTFIVSSAVLPIFSNGRTLPLTFISYPFDWAASPYYEILWCMQVMILFFTLGHIAIGADMLVMAILLIISNQYRILQSCFLAFNTEDMYVINKKMRQLIGDKLEEHHYDVKREYFIRCVRHHQLLLKFTKTFNNVFNPMELGQLLYSIVAVCFGTLKLSSMKNISPMEDVMTITYFIASLTQLLFDCFPGTLLYNQASLLPESIFQSNWENLTDNKLKNDVKFVLLHSQRIPQFSAYGLYDMNMLSYLKVLKAAFSFYTVLSVLERKSLAS